MRRLREPVGRVREWAAAGGGWVFAPRASLRIITSGPGGDEHGAPVDPDYPDVDRFVDDFLVAHYARVVVGREHDQATRRRWCVRWRDHPEAVARLGALWSAYEALRGSATGRSRWWTEHADPQLGALMAPDGPFARCSPQECHPPGPLGSG